MYILDKFTQWWDELEREREIRQVEIETEYDEAWNDAIDAAIERLNEVRLDVWARDLAVAECKCKRDAAAARVDGINDCIASLGHLKRDVE